MTIYLINLDRREDRLNTLRETCDGLGLAFTRVAATDGMQLSMAMPNWPYPITPAEVGCFLSHKECLQLIANGDDEYGIILEDDVKFSAQNVQYMKDTKWVPEDADIVKLDTCDERVRIKDIIDLPGTNIRAGRLTSSHIGAAGYIVSKNASIKLLSLLDDMSIPIDRVLFTNDLGVLNDLFVYQVIPAICRQSGSPSTINMDRVIWMQSMPRSVRPKLTHRIVREIKRPFKVILHFIASNKVHLQKRLQRGKSWMQIPFE